MGIALWPVGKWGLKGESIWGEMGNTRRAESDECSTLHRLGAIKVYPIGRDYNLTITGDKWEF